MEAPHQQDTHAVRGSEPDFSCTTVQPGFFSMSEHGFRRAEKLPLSQIEPRKHLKKEMPAAMTSKGIVADRHRNQGYLDRVPFRAQQLRRKLQKRIFLFGPGLFLVFFGMNPCRRSQSLVIQSSQLCAASQPPPEIVSRLARQGAFLLSAERVKVTSWARSREPRRRKKRWVRPIVEPGNRLWGALAGSRRSRDGQAAPSESRAAPRHGPCGFAAPRT